MLFSCMTPLRRLSFATSKLSHVCCDIPWTKSGKPGSKRFADHRPFEIVGTVCRSNYITSDEVRETLSEMYLPLFCRCPHLNQPKMLELTWRLPTVVLLLSLPFATVAAEGFPRTRERAHAIREDIVAGWIYCCKILFQTLLYFVGGFEYYLILRNGKLQNVEEYFSNFSNRRMKAKFHFFFGRFGLQDLFDLVASVTNLLYTLDLPRVSCLGFGILTQTFIWPWVMVANEGFFEGNGPLPNM